MAAHVRMTLENAAMVRIEDVSVSFRRDSQDSYQALAAVNLQVRNSEFVCLLGPSGCGKTTLLNAVAGFVLPATGRILVGNRLVTEPSPECGMVFQEYGLFPWFTVRQNVEFGPRVRGLPSSEVATIADSYIDLVGLRGFESFYPKSLSGGMKQRAGLARALANHPTLLLLDEPFAAVDALTRDRLQEELLGLWERERITCVFVTHSVAEAVFLADRVVVMQAQPGRVSAELKVDLPRPRDRNSVEFVRVQRDVAQLVAGTSESRRGS